MTDRNAVVCPSGLAWQAASHNPTSGTANQINHRVLKLFADACDFLIWWDRFRTCLTSECTGRTRLKTAISRLFSCRNDLRINAKKPQTQRRKARASEAWNVLENQKETSARKNRSHRTLSAEELIGSSFRQVSWLGLRRRRPSRAGKAQWRLSIVGKNRPYSGGDHAGFSPASLFSRCGKTGSEHLKALKRTRLKMRRNPTTQFKQRSTSQRN